MRTLLAAMAALALVVLPSASAHSAAASSTPAPKNLRGFLLRPDESVTHTFSRTPAFAWAPVRAARCYQFELATTKAFTENSLVWTNVDYKVGSRATCDAKGLRVPAASIDVALPWFTGQPSALYAHVRAIGAKGVSNWSAPFGFDMRWNNVASPLPAQPGLMRWTPVSGATGYDVWLTDVGHIFSATTNVADQREQYTLHPFASMTSTVHWRVRAVRRLYGKIPSGLPAVSYGPWSSVYTSTNPRFATGKLELVTSLSDRVSDAHAQQPHELMPGFSFRGNIGLNGSQAFLFRVYVTTDRDCVNVVFRGPAVGGPGYAPRTAGPLKLPATESDLTDAAAGEVLPMSKGDEGVPTVGADFAPFVTNEAVKGLKEGADTSGTSADKSQLVKGAKVDLPDTGFPTTRYYWTVVPVDAFTSEDGKGFEYRDLELPQDACAAGRVQSFSKASEPVVIADGGAPYLSGMTPKGRLLAAARRSPSVYGSAVIAWRPAVAALQYEVQWSRTNYPWNAVGSKTTFATSAVLDLSPGRWFYRVRGLNPDRIGKPQMTWSAPVAVRVASPTFTIVKS